MPTTFWSLTYESVPREDVQDELLLSIMLRRLKEEGQEYLHACCVEGGDWPETPESIVAFLNRQFPDSPMKYVRVQKREITAEEYKMQREDKERRAARNAESMRELS